MAFASDELILNFFIGHISVISTMKSWKYHCFRLDFHIHFHRWNWSNFILYVFFSSSVNYVAFYLILGSRMPYVELGIICSLKVWKILKASRSKDFLKLQYNLHIAYKFKCIAHWILHPCNHYTDQDVEHLYYLSNFPRALS